MSEYNFSFGDVSILNRYNIKRRKFRVVKPLVKSVSINFGGRYLPPNSKEDNLYLFSSDINTDKCHIEYSLAKSVYNSGEGGGISAINFSDEGMSYVGGVDWFIYADVQYIIHTVNGDKTVNKTVSRIDFLPFDMNTIDGFMQNNSISINDVISFTVIVDFINLAKIVTFDCSNPYLVVYNNLDDTNNSLKEMDIKAIGYNTLLFNGFPNLLNSINMDGLFSTNYFPLIVVNGDFTIGIENDSSYIIEKNNL
ncbi:MAG: hypothetical protein DI598_07515 [Pseudopedobacter saltans]|uniref:Uncharacterized protein n=1 Tax=Pseudopedobacter saltans TaxID=151895 RepID=A0A2W5H1Q1_9SPHI|nr:MAG: hypothetical protein DI598_07515 [Pseudopedobacter saltans]